MERLDLRSLFDWAWYAHRHGLEGEDAAWRHYSTEGINQHLDPNPLFDSQWYHANNRSSLGPGALHHFLSSRVSQMLRPSPLFESDWYLETNPDVHAAGLNPFVHYVKWGRHERRLPNRWCDPEYTGDPLFEIELQADFRPDDLIGYIPYYTTLARLLSGGEATAFFSPRTPRWIMAKLTGIGEADGWRDEVALLGGRREIFSGKNAYISDRLGDVPPIHHAFQVRYAISPVIDNAVSALGRDLGSAEKIDALRHGVAEIAAVRTDLPLSSMNLVVDAGVAAPVRAHFAGTPLSPVTILSLQQGYLCRVTRLMLPTR